MIIAVRLIFLFGRFCFAGSVLQPKPLQQRKKLPFSYRSPPAFSLFNYDRTTEEGPGDVRSSGSGALAFENDRSKLVYFSFGFEGIEPFEDRVTLLGNILSWFHMPAQVRGDVNGDGPINALDVVLAVRIALGTYDPTEEELERGDVNFDGVIDVTDILGIVDRLLHGSG